MRAFVVFLLTCFSTVSADQKTAVQHLTQDQMTSTRQLHERAIASTVVVVAGPQTPTESSGSGVWVSKEGYVATCWHVVKNASDVQVKVAYPGVYDLEKNIFVNAAFSLYAATVVASDEKADVAILKVSPNPFAAPPAISRIVSGGAELKPASANLRTSLPNPGDLVLLAGYPLGRPDLLTQSGTVAGVALVYDYQGTEASKGVRILLSLVSNPSNSGGPVFDSDGKLLGLLSADFLSPVLRRKLDAGGNPAGDAGGQPQFEATPMLQNSGISIVVPARFVQNALDQAEGKAPAATPKGSVVIQGLEVINAPPDTGPKLASSLSIAELKHQTASFLFTFRNFLSQQEQRQRQLAESAIPALPTTTREERQAALAKLGEEYIALGKDIRQQYQTSFKAEAKRLRDDCWARLPTAARDPRSVRLYDYGLDLVELRHLADDLERLSKMLPE